MVELSPFQQRVLETYPPPRLFALVSWGCAGTSWLAYALNSHPDIYCVHNANYFWKTFGGAPALGGADYLRVIGAQGHAHTLAGDVHGVSQSDVPDIVRVFGEKFRAGVVIREPLSRLRSQLALMRFFEAHPAAWNVEHVQNFSSALGYDASKLSIAQKRRLHAVNMLNAIIDEVRVGPVFKIEEIGSSPEAFARMLEWISGGTVVASASWLNQVIRLRRVNSHSSRSNETITAEDLHLLKALVKPEAWRLYESLGYEAPAL